MRGDVIALALLLIAGAAEADNGPRPDSPPVGYQRPPEEVVRVLDAMRAAAPLAVPSPDGKWVLAHRFQQRAPITEVGAPQIAVGSGRFNAITGEVNSVVPWFEQISLESTNGVSAPRMQWPRGKLGLALWSPDSLRFAFSRETPSGLELWMAEPATGELARVPDILVSRAFSLPYQRHALLCSWAPKQTLWCQAQPPGRGAPPTDEQASPTPQIQDSGDRETDTAALVLRPLARVDSPYKEALYDYYMTSQLARVDAVRLGVTYVGRPGIFKSAVPSPDGRYVLTVRYEKPYSKLVGDTHFPRANEILDENGAVVRLLSREPADPAGNEFQGWAFAGVRFPFWRPDRPSAVAWYEALDGGNPMKAAAARDRLMTLDTPLTAEPRELLRTAGRMLSSRAGTFWSDDGLAIVQALDWSNQKRESWVLTDRRGRVSRQPLTGLRESEQLVPAVASGSGFFRGMDSRLPVRPFNEVRGTVLVHGLENGKETLDRLNLRTGARTPVYRVQPRVYEELLAVLDSRGSRVLVETQSAETPPSAGVRQVSTGALTLLGGANVDKAAIAGIRHYKLPVTRADGVSIPTVVYEVGGRKAGEQRPAMVMTYPERRETQLGNWDGLINDDRWLGTVANSGAALATEGYVIAFVTLPILPRNGVSGNEVFIEQAREGAQAVVDRLVREVGVDRCRIAIQGHSDGANLAVQLMASTQLFAAGIGSAGYYLADLNPFGIVLENRTFWEAPQIYDTLSPYRRANQISAPLLLLHGAEDNSAGANAIHSQKLYEALYGLGKTTRLVILPHEGHGFVARESVLHEQWETLRWLDEHIGRGPSAGVTSAGPCARAGASSPATARLQ